MNYLAHLFLADCNRLSLLGNLMGDFVKGRIDNTYPDVVTDGLILHRQIDKFTEEGLYLILPNGNCICISQNNINNYFKKLWDDGSVFPPHIKRATELDFCEHCPAKYSDEEFCVAIRPVLPFLEEVDKYVSHDKVTAIIKTNNPSVISIKHTDLQHALKYVSILSLINYCETNRKFWPYYFGISPFSDMEQVLSQIYVNIFIAHSKY